MKFFVVRIIKFAQRRPSGAPHCSQNFAATGFSCSHVGHFILNPAARRAEHRRGQGNGGPRQPQGCVVVCSRSPRGLAILVLWDRSVRAFLHQQQEFVSGEMGFRVSLQRSNPEPLRSALGQKRTLTLVQPMSALPPKADIAERLLHVRCAIIGLMHCSIQSP